MFCTPSKATLIRPHHTGERETECVTWHTPMVFTTAFSLRRAFRAKQQMKINHCRMLIRLPEVSSLLRIFTLALHHSTFATLSTKAWKVCFECLKGLGCHEQDETCFRSFLGLLSFALKWKNGLWKPHQETWLCLGNLHSLYITLLDLLRGNNVPCCKVA